MKTLPTILTLLPLLATAFSGCQQRAIMEEGDELQDVTIVFDWRKAPGAKVEGMTMFFYPLSKGGQIWRYDLASQEGGEVALPIGEYEMVAVNNDLPGIEFTGEGSYATFTAETRETADNNVISAPGILYGTIIKKIDVTPCGVSYTTSDQGCKDCPKSIVTCFPDSLSTLYTIKITDVEGHEHTKSVSASLQGVGTSLLITQAISETTGTTSYFPMSYDSATQTLTGSASAFLSTVSTPRYSLRVMAAMKDGKNYVKVFDVTQQVLNFTNCHNVIIVIKGLTFPTQGEEEPPDIGMSVEVDGWEVYEIDYDTSTPSSRKRD